MDYLKTIGIMVENTFPLFAIGALLAFAVFLWKPCNIFLKKRRELLFLCVLLFFPLCWRIIFIVRGKRYGVILVFGCVVLTVWLLQQIPWKYVRRLVIAIVLVICLTKYLCFNFHSRDFCNLLDQLKEKVDAEPQGAEIFEYSHGQQKRFEYYSGLKIRSLSHLSNLFSAKLVLSLNLDAISRSERPVYIITDERRSNQSISAEQLGLPTSNWKWIMSVFRNNSKKSRYSLYRLWPLSTVPKLSVEKNLLINGTFEAPANYLFCEKFQRQLPGFMQAEYPPSNHPFPANWHWILLDGGTSGTWVRPSAHPISGTYSLEIAADRYTALSFVEPKLLTIGTGKLLQFKARGERNGTQLRFVFHYFNREQLLGWAGAEYTLSKGELIEGRIPILPIELPLNPETRLNMTIYVFDGQLTLDDISLREIGSEKTKQNELQ